MDGQALAHPSEEPVSLSPTLKPVFELTWMAEYYELRTKALFSGSPSEADVGGHQESGLWPVWPKRRQEGWNRKRDEPLKHLSCFRAGDPH